MARLQIEQTPVWFDIKDIAQDKSKQIKFDTRAMLHTEKEDFVILHLRSEEFSCNYIEDFAEEYFVEFEMLLGDYAFKLYPNRGNLEMSIKMIEQQETGSARKVEQPISQQRYKAVFLAKENKAIAASELDTMDYNTLNLQGPVRVKLQLILLPVEPLRIKMLTGSQKIFRNVKPEDLIRCLLQTHSDEIKLNNRKTVDAIDIFPPDNKEPRLHYVLPDDLMLTDLTSYLQDVEGGVYLHGMGTFFQAWKGKNTWFVYPLWRIGDPDKDQETMVFYNLPKHRFPGLDRTYKTIGKTTRVLITSDQEYRDSGEANFMVEGTGVRFVDARAIMRKPIDLKSDTPIADRTRLVNEVTLLERKDGLNFAPFTKDRITSNPYKQYSEMNHRNLARVDLVWENSNPFLLRPNMPCKYVFIKDNKVVSLKGIIAQHETYTTHQGHGINQSTYRSVTHLVLYVERYTQSKTTDQLPYEGDF